MNDSPAVLARVQDGKHAGWLPRDAPDVGTGEAGSLSAGAMTRIQLRISPESERVIEAVFKVVGSSGAIASASLVAERLQGTTVSAAKDLEGLAIVAELQLPIETAAAATFAIEAARAAIDDWERKNNSGGRGREPRQSE